jgi:hypothetical protein
MTNCVDIIRPLFEETDRRQLAVQSLGGLGSAALLLTETKFESREKGIYAPSDMIIPTLRDNGSPHDVDICVLSTKLADIEAVEEIGANTIGYTLDVNVFGFHDMAELDAMKRNPTSGNARYASVSDRYMPTPTTEALGEGTTSANEDSFIKAVFPFGVTVPKEALETWTLHIGNHTHIPVPHPAIMLLNNLTRSIGGPRQKYDKKVPLMYETLRRADPELIAWMIDGPGKSHIELAAVLRTVGSRRIHAKPVAVGPDFSKPAPSFRELRDHQAFLMRDAPRDQQNKVLALAKTRGIIVGTVEDHLMDFWEEKGLERYFKSIVRNSHPDKKATSGSQQ